MSSAKIHGRFLPSRVFNRWKWAARFGLMVVPFVLLFFGGIRIYLEPSQYQSATLFEIGNGPPPQEMVELAKSEAVLLRVVDHLKLGDRWDLDVETAKQILLKKTTAAITPGTKLMEITVTLPRNTDAREIAASIPESLTQHLTEAVQRNAAEKTRDIDRLLTKAQDQAAERASEIAQLEKLHGANPGDPAFTVQQERARRASLLADAEVERVRALRSAWLTENLGNKPKLTIHTAPVVSSSTIDSKGDELGELALQCLVAGLLVALLLPYLLELAFPPLRERMVEADPVALL